MAALTLKVFDHDFVLRCGAVVLEGASPALIERGVVKQLSAACL